MLAERHPKRTFEDSAIAQLIAAGVRRMSHARQMSDPLIKHLGNAKGVRTTRGNSNHRSAQLMSSRGANWKPR